MLARKLGVRALEGEDDDKLLDDLFEVLQAVETDMTLFFRLLANVPVDARAESAGRCRARRAVAARVLHRRRVRAGLTLARMAAWLRRYAARVRRDDTSDDGAPARA